MSQAEAKLPFIVWTMQRTGGTNLAQRLFERSGLLRQAKDTIPHDSKAARWLEGLDSEWRLHEPFNIADSRAFGRISEGWAATRDAAALEKTMENICSLRLPIKHCVEMTPMEIGLALARMSCKYGYKHIFLYRKHAVNRLLSLHFARQSGIWGAHFRGRNELEAKIFAEPLPVQDLVRHEKFCSHRLTEIWRLLESLGSEPSVIAFEEIYEAKNTADAQELLLSLLSELGLIQGAKSDQEFVTEIIRRGKQGTRDAYAKFTGIEALRQSLDSSVKLSLAGEEYQLEIEKLRADHSVVLHAVLDLVPKVIRPGLGAVIGGVVVLNEPLSGAAIYMVSDAGERQLRWGIQSPLMNERFPNGSNSAKARFKAGVRFRRGESVEVCLKWGDGESTPLFRLRTREAKSNLQVAIV